MADSSEALARADMLLLQRDLTAALGMFSEAQLLGANVGHCTWGRWMACMLSGDFGGAWRESDAIRTWDGEDPERLWQGEDLGGKQVIVRCLHGFGDTVQMLQYAPRLQAVCARVILEVPPRFAELAPYFMGLDCVITWDQPAPAWEAQVEVMELPHLFRTQLAELPLVERYLSLPEAARERVRAVLGERERPRIGMVWAAGDWNPERSLPFAFVKDLVGEEARCEFWSLQGGAEQEGWAGLRQAGLRDAAECGDGLMTLAAVVSEMDLVITVDTLAAHLAGALGVPAWVMLQHAADWRWMVERDDSPWYPSLTLFRQSAPGDWAGVVERVRTQLGACLRSGGSLQSVESEER